MADNENMRLRTGGRPRKRKPTLCELQSRELARKLFTGRDYQMFVLSHWGQGDEPPYTVEQLCARISPQVKASQCKSILKRLNDAYDAAEAQIIANATPVVTLDFTPSHLIEERFTYIAERGDTAMAKEDVTAQQALGRELNKLGRILSRRVEGKLREIEEREAA